jgi:transposase
MHIDSTSRAAPNGQIYTRHLLRTSYREGGKVKKETIANLSHCSDEEIVAMRLALRHKSNICELGSLSEDVSMLQGTSFGATYVLNEVAKKIGITDALGDSREGKLALWQILARVMDQGSRLSAVRLAQHHNVTSILDLQSFNEDHLYANLDWIAENQAMIEQSLIKFRKEETESYFLYDITSSYLEGMHNELANWGYNRDKKNGKMQIVVGLLCNTEGIPLSVEVFEGNTADCTTVGEQMNKISKKWGCQSITLVGDKGMIQGPQIESIESCGHNFITTIAKSQIEKLVVAAGYQTTLIDEDLLDIIVDGYRYIMRRNPIQAEKTSEKRSQLISAVRQIIVMKNAHLVQHPKAKLSVAEQKVKDKIEKFKLNGFLTVTINEDSRQLTLVVDDEKKYAAAKLDGCYAMKTNIDKTILPKEVIQKKYKALALVEDAFRCSKTELLELRPIHVRLEKRTRGHVFVVMLSYLIIKELESAWKAFNLTAQEGIDTLKNFQTIYLTVKGKSMTQTVPTPNASTKMLFDALDIAIPKNIPTSEEIVATRKKIGLDRK